MTLSHMHQAQCRLAYRHQLPLLLQRIPPLPMTLNASSTHKLDDGCHNMLVTAELQTWTHFSNTAAMCGGQSAYVQNAAPPNKCCKTAAKQLLVPSHTTKRPSPSTHTQLQLMHSVRIGLAYLPNKLPSFTRHCRCASSLLVLQCCGMSCWLCRFASSANFLGLLAGLSLCCSVNCYFYVDHTMGLADVWPAEILCYSTPSASISRWQESPANSNLHSCWCSPPVMFSVARFAAALLLRSYCNTSGPYARFAAGSSGSSSNAATNSCNSTLRHRTQHM